MDKLPEKADSQVRVFKEDNEWLNKKARERHTIAAVILHDLVKIGRKANKVLLAER